MYGPRSSNPDLDLPDDDEIEDMAAALGKLDVFGFVWIAQKCIHIVAFDSDAS